MRQSLRTSLPLTLLAFLLVASGINFYSKSQETELEIRSEAKQQLKIIGNLISANVETGIRYGLSTIVHSAIEQSQSSRSIRYSFLVDDRNYIFSSNQRELQNKPLYEITENILSNYLAKLPYGFHLEFAKLDSPWLIYQIPLVRQSEDNIFAQKLERLVLISNIQSQLDKSNVLLLEELMQWLFISSLITLLLWLVLKYIVVDPIAYLRRLAISLAEGTLIEKQGNILMSEFESLDRSIRDAAKKINDLESSYQELYDKNPAIFITVNDNYEIVNINDYGLNTLGFKKDDILGKNASCLYEVEDRELFLQYLEQIVRSSYPMNHWELRRLKKSGQVFWSRDGARLIEQFGKKYILIVSQDISDLHKMSQKLSYQASHDDLTGLVNRPEFTRLLSMSLEKAQVQGNNHCVCFLDLDQFKVINDVCGHAAGDALLKQISELLKQSLRRDDVLARIGGDEFGLLLESCSPEKAMEIIQTMRVLLSTNRFNWGDKFFDVGISAGIAIISKDTRSIQNVLSEADSACYLAKEKGRNRSILFNSSKDDGASLLGEMQWIDKINAALDSNDGFTLYFQRIKPLGSAKALFFKGEVLIRMNLDGNVIPPGAFLPAAERYNMAYKIDHWVVKKALTILKEYKDSLPDDWSVSINLSAQTISRPNFNVSILELLKANLDISKHICFEVTETAAMANLNGALEFILKLDKLGVKFALDDFGSGFCSFGYLKKMPAQFVKIDGMFVKELLESEVDKELVASMNNIAHALNKETIAEYVENEGSVTILRNIGVDYGQGYFIHKPEPLVNCLRDPHGSTQGSARYGAKAS